MATAAELRTSFLPPTPQTMEQTGVPQTLVLDLMIRRLLLEGYSTLGILSEKLHVALTINYVADFAGYFVLMMNRLAANLSL